MKNDTDLWNTLVSLCFYYGSGTRTSFYTIVERAFGSLGLSLSATQRTVLGRNLYSKLLTFGLLSRVSGVTDERWSSGENRLFWTSAGVIPLGDLDFRRKFYRHVDEEPWSVHLIAPLPKEFSQFNLSSRVFSERVINKCRVIDGKIIPIKKFNAERLLALIPHFEETFTQLTNELEAHEVSLIFEKSSVETYLFDTGDWCPFSGVVPSRGLFRVRYEYGSPRWILSDPNCGYWEVTEGDWSVAIARVILKEPVEVRFNPDQDKLSIEGRHLDTFSSLVRALLMGVSYQWPAFVDGDYVFHSVEPQMLRQLLVKLPAFKGDNVE